MLLRVAFKSVSSEEPKIRAAIITTEKTFPTIPETYFPCKRKTIKLNKRSITVIPTLYLSGSILRLNNKKQKITEAIN